MDEKISVDHLRANKNSVGANTPTSGKSAATTRRRVLRAGASQFMVFSVSVLCGSPPVPAWRISGPGIDASAEGAI